MKDLLKLIYLQPHGLPAHISNYRFFKRKAKNMGDSLDVSIQMDSAQTLVSVFLKHDEQADVIELEHAINNVTREFLNYEARKVLRHAPDSTTS